MDGPANLARLSELGGGLPDGGPDVRGWEVIGADGARIGRAVDLIVERESRLLRFLDVELEDDLAQAPPAASPAHQTAPGAPAGATILGDVTPDGATSAAPPAESRAERETEVLPMAGPRPPRMRLPDDRPASDL